MRFSNYKLTSKSWNRKSNNSPGLHCNNSIGSINRYLATPDNFSFGKNSSFSKLHLRKSCFTNLHFLFRLLLLLIGFLTLITKKIVLNNLKSLLRRVDPQMEAKKFQPGKVNSQHKYKLSCKLLSCDVCNWQDVQLSDNWEILPFCFGTQRGKKAKTSNYF